MSVPHILPSQVRNLEARVGHLEETIEAHENTLYELRRDVTGLKLDMETLLGHFGLPSATAEQIDAALDEQ